MKLSKLINYNSINRLSLNQSKHWVFPPERGDVGVTGWEKWEGSEFREVDLSASMDPVRWVMVHVVGVVVVVVVGVHVVVMVCNGCVSHHRNYYTTPTH